MWKKRKLVEDNIQGSLGSPLAKKSNLDKVIEKSMLAESNANFK